MNKNKKSKRDVILGILLISVISLCIFNFLEMRDLIGLKVNLDKGIQLNGMHWECEREYETTKKIGCDFRCEVSELVYQTYRGRGGTELLMPSTIDLKTGQMFIYETSNDVATCYELKDFGCEITWKYEKACTRDILVRDK